jgi:hypothetical protein
MFFKKRQIKEDNTIIIKPSLAGSLNPALFDALKNNKTICKYCKNFFDSDDGFGRCKPTVYIEDYVFGKINFTCCSEKNKYGCCHDFKMLDEISKIVNGGE